MFRTPRLLVQAKSKHTTLEHDNLEQSNMSLLKANR
jgi:hypothetical protein